MTRLIHGVVIHSGGVPEITGFSGSYPGLPISVWPGTSHYGVGLVTADVKPRFFTFQLKACDESSMFCNESTLRVRMEDYLDRFTLELFRLTTSHYKARPALFVIFDGTSSRLPWHVPLDPDRPDLMKAFLLEDKPSVEGVADPEKVRSLLCTALQAPHENWGVFEAERQSASTLRFTYERRCREALASA